MKRIIHPPPGPIKLPTSQADVDKFLSRKFTLENFLFDQQLAFVRDEAPFKVAVCSRRSGKTIACAAHLIHTAITNPDTISLYITLSRNNAKKLIWREIIKFNETYKLGGIPDISELSMTFPNKSVIYISGCKD